MRSRSGLPVIRIGACCWALLVTAGLPAQRTSAPPAQTPAPSLTVSAELDAIKRLKWRSIGPANQAGRIPVVVGIAGDRSTYYVGSAAGGLIKTTNGGVTFTQLFDHQDNASIGDLAIAPSDPNILYLGSGEGNPRNSASIGDGVYKSVDAGRTWKKIGLENVEKIPRLRIDPRNPDVVYVCALGRTWGPNEDRGLYKTRDGGKTWSRILYKDALTGCSDVDIDPGNANIVYAGMYSHQRWPWYFTSGGGETALYKSSDGGDTWTRLSGPGNTRGLPKGPMDRIGVSVHRADPDIVYMLTETKDEGEMWRSDDAGETWRMTSRDRNINFRPFYYADVRADPKNPNVVYTLSGSLYKSEDGGRTFRTIARDVHGDHQALWIDPTDPNYLISGSDGGWQLSYDAGRNFEIVNTVSFDQFYHVTYDMEKPYNLCGGLQDNGHWCGPSQVLSNQGNRKNSWVTVSGGDGFFAVPDLQRPWLIYSASQGGNILLTDIRSGDQRSIHPYPNRVGSAGDSLASHKYRFNWNSPIVLDPTDPKTVYFGGNVLFRTTDFGQSWTQISPDLTTNDKSRQGSSGGPIVTDNTAAEFYNTLLTIAPSPKDASVIWAGTDDGNVQLTRDGGKTWTNTAKNLPGLPPGAWISTIDASPHEAGTAFVAASHWQTGDYAPYAYMTTDYGQTWKRITSNLPSRGWVHVVRQDPRNANLLYLGTEFGIFVSWDRGGRWQSLRNGLSAAPVRDLVIHPRDNDLIIATHGRGLYVLDDLTPLQKLGEAMATDAYVFDPRPATRWVMWNADANLGQKVWVGENPPYGATISYYLKNNEKDTVRVTVSDNSGNVIRTLRAAPGLAGVNRVTWDLRYDGSPPPRVVGTNPDAEDADLGPRFGFGGAGGPTVVPGEYVFTIRLNGQDFRKTVRVDLDPRAPATTADLVAQRDKAIELRDLNTRVTTVIDRNTDLMRQLTVVVENLRRNAPSEKEALNEAESALRDLKSLRDETLLRPIQGLGYRQYPRLRDEITSLYGSVSRGVSRPTDAQVQRSGELQGEATTAAASQQKIIDTRIAKLNQLLKNLPHVVVPGGAIM
ncbi:MAG: hypothetical protein MNPFHGCM_01709 [Gemmatimonadaceae bacterium]|nr:hypothetical protein [Gemmatimonadaceae bacterium]